MRIVKIDKEILEEMEKVLEWEGIIGYTSQILNWVKDYVDMGGNFNE